MRRFIRSNVEDMLAEKIISDYNKTITVARLGYNTEENKLTVECM